LSVLVLDASMALDACTHDAGFGLLGDHELIAPPLLWSEVRSALHEAVWRGVLTRALAEDARRELTRSRVRSSSPRALDATAWAIADELGVAKTYDAEYLALARLRGCRVVTTDARLRRGADRLGLVVGPTEV
jgi:predicted nucleic acid-binding protein